MTRDERLDLLKQIEKDIYVSSIESTFLEDAKSCAIHSVIEELEQEPKQEFYDRLEYGTDGNIYKLSLTNGTEYEQGPEPVYFPPCVDCQDRSKEILTAYNNMKKMQTYTKEEVITMLEEIKAEIKEKEKEYLHNLFIGLDAQDKTEHEKIIDIIDQKTKRLKR